MDSTSSCNSDKIDADSDDIEANSDDIEANRHCDATTWVGKSCGHHGAYAFYKAFRFHLRAQSQRRITFLNSMKHDHDRNNSDVTRTSASNADDVRLCISCRHSKVERILALGEFFFMQCRPEDPVCIGELQLLWHDKQSGLDLSSTRLYYIPETTPEGRLLHHGKDEVLAVSEKIVMKTHDLSSCIVELDQWNYGSSLPLVSSPNKSNIGRTLSSRYSLLPSYVDMSDVTEARIELTREEKLCPPIITNNIEINEEKQPTLDSNQASQCKVMQAETQRDRHKAQALVLSMAGYSRHMAAMKRIEGTQKQWLSKACPIRMLSTLGVYTSAHPTTRLVFCRDTFEHPEILEYAHVCEQLAPVFKGRPRRKARKLHSFLALRSQVKREIIPDGYQGTITCSGALDPCTDKRDIDDSPPTLQSSDRRRSKRRLSLKVTNEEQYPALTKRPERKFRPGTHSVQDPSEAKSSKKVAPAFISDPQPSSPNTCLSSSAFQDFSEAVCPAASNHTLTTEQQPKQITTQLEINKVSDLQPPFKDKEEEICSPAEWEHSLASLSFSGSLNSYIQASSTQSNLSTSSTSCPSSSFHPSSLDGQLFPLVDVSTIMTSTDSQSNINNLEQTTSEENMYIRGLCDGNLPENKSAFLELLYQFMQKRNTPIGRIPSLGFKKLDLWAFFMLSQEFGGYEMVTAKRLWKHVYDRMGGNPSCTSAATCTRKHFERLLLPLETYLRKKLSNKESKHAKHEPMDASSLSGKVVFDESPLNGRTFNGDAYFRNGPTFSQSPLLVIKQRITPEMKPLPSPEDAQSHFSPSSNLSPSSNHRFTRKFSQASNCSSIYNKEARVNLSTIMAQAPMVNLESLTHNIIQEELLADRQSKSDSLHESSMEDLTTSEKSKETNSKFQSDYPIDFTNPGREKQNSISSSASQPIISENVSRVDQTSPKVFTETSSHPRFQIFTRTHCPRVSMVPPPYVPKQSSQASTTTDPSSKRNPLDCHQWDKPQHTKPQKRHLVDDNSERRNASSSPNDPKRPRHSSLLTTPSPSNRSYDIRNLVSTPSDNPKEKSCFQSQDPVQDEKNHLLRHVSCESGKKTDAEMQNEIESHQPPYCYHPKEQKDCERRLSTNIHRSPVERHDFHLMASNMDRMIQRPKEKTSLTGFPKVMSTLPSERVCFRTPTRYLGVFGKQNSGDFQWNEYYSNGLVSSHQKPSRQDSSSVKNPQNRSGSAGFHHPQQDDVVLNKTTPHPPSASMKNFLNITRSPHMVLQRPLETEKRKSLSSLFSVDDAATSFTARSPTLRPHPRSSKHQQQPRDLNSASIVGAKLSRDVVSLSSVGPEYQPRHHVEDNNCAVIRDALMSCRRDDASHSHDTSSSDLRHKFNQQAFIATSPVTTETSSNEPSTKAMLDGLPLSLVNLIRPLIPPNCTPAMLENFLQQYVSSIVASVPQMASSPNRLNNIHPYPSRSHASSPPRVVITEPSMLSAHKNDKATSPGHDSIRREESVAMALRAHSAARLTHVRQHYDDSLSDKASDKQKVVNLITRLTAEPQMEFRNPAFMSGISHHTPHASAIGLAYGYDRR